MRAVWRARPVLLWALALVVWPPTGWAQSARLETTEHFYTMRTTEPFEEVILSLTEAIQRRNYVVTGINSLDTMLQARREAIGSPAFDYDRYKVIGFCNLSLADEAIRVNPRIGAFMPCRAVVFREPGTGQTVVVIFRPAVLAAALGSDMQPLMQQVDKDILAILDAVAGD